MNLSLSFNVSPDSSLPSDEFTNIIARQHTILIPHIEKKRMLCAQVLGQCALAINHDGTWVVLWIPRIKSIWNELQCGAQCLTQFQRNESKISYLLRCLLT